MEKIIIKINGVEITAQKGMTILQAVWNAEKEMPYLEINIPTLYYLTGVQEEDLSGICVVEVVGKEELVEAWAEQVEDGMEIFTESERVVQERIRVLKELLKEHDHDCVGCSRTTRCELQQLLYRYNVEDEKERKYAAYELDQGSIIVRDNNKCIHCQRCVAACSQVQSVCAIQAEEEDGKLVVRPADPKGLQATKCVNCGQCIASCPVGALRERDDVDAVLEELRNPEKYVVVQTAPSVRAALGEEFGFPIGSDVEGRLPAALRALGFDRVFDTQFSADLTIMEEATEFISRVQNGGILPLMTSCCPGWIKFCEHEYPDLLGNLSSCKSPHQMQGSVIKTYFASISGIRKEDIVVVSIMPCVAKKFEITRDDENGAGVPDVDYSLTTRELAEMLRREEIQFEAMPSESFDDPLGKSTGAAVIFGATGGVMEAALRTAYEVLTEEELSDVEFQTVRGIEGVKESVVNIAGNDIHVAVVSGLANARIVLDRVRSGEANYEFIEVMACPGGCVNGGGQPIQSAHVRGTTDLRVLRAQALYQNDENRALRKSHENPDIIELYEKYLEKPGSEIAHELLHTTYVDRSED